MRNLKNSLHKRVERATRRVQGWLYEPMRPAGVVLGAQKGGTTALFHYLSQHPDVVPSMQKEIHFFNNDEHYARGLDFYHGFFERRTPAREGKITLDITPSYLAAAPLTAQRLSCYEPALRLVALLRDPVTRAYSAWQMYRKYYARDPDWFDGWVGSCLVEGFPAGCRKRSARFGQSFLDDAREELEWMERGQLVEMPFIHQGFYVRHLEWFLRYFPREQLLVMSSEELKADTRGHLQALEQHFGLSPHAWREEQIRPHFEGGYSEPLPDGARRLLAEYYRPHNRELFELLGREIDWS